MINVLKGKHILIIVENLPVPFDTRVWQEACALKEYGARVTIICPRNDWYLKKKEKINGIYIYRHPQPHEAKRLMGYILEYSNALFWEFILSLKVFLKCRFHVIHGCNPPDLIFLIGLFYKIFGVKYIFDHHDLVPELFESKYNDNVIALRLAKTFERLTFMTANLSIATNNSYKEIAIGRDKMLSDKVFVVRSGPSIERLKVTSGNIKFKKGKKYLIGYLGVIGEQEGLEILLKIVEIILLKTNDVHFAIVGDGPKLNSIKKLSRGMGLTNCIDFYGRIPDEELIDIINTADICVNTDKSSSMNNLSTMNKIMEYMALKKPIIQFKCKEGHFTAQKASLYIEHNDIYDFADKILWLLNHDSERKEMGEFGYSRVMKNLLWDYQKVNLIKAYESIFK